jgi:hypothetical protein
MEASIRERKDSLSRYIRRGEAGERVLVRCLGTCPSASNRSRTSQFEALIASGVITPPVEDGDPLEDCPEIRLAPDISLNDKP